MAEKMKQKKLSQIFRELADKLDANGDLPVKAEIDGQQLLQAVVDRGRKEA